MATVTGNEVEIEVNLKMSLEEARALLEYLDCDKEGFSQVRIRLQRRYKEADGTYGIYKALGDELGKY